MENYFIPYEQALALKELGFDEPCLTFYTYKGKFSNELSFNDYKNTALKTSAPLYQQAFKFFRERPNLLEHSVIRVSEQPYDKGKIRKYLGYIQRLTQQQRGLGIISSETYEEAELECLKKLIEIVQKEIKNKTEINDL